MRSPLKTVALVAVVVLAAWAALAWPHLNRVETGRTPECPDLAPHVYAAKPPEVTKAVQAAVEKLGWHYVGSGSGPGGSQLQADGRLPLVPLPCEVRILVRSEKGRTAV